MVCFMFLVFYSPIDRTWYDALEKAVLDTIWYDNRNDMGCIIWTYCIISCNYLQQLWIQVKNIFGFLFLLNYICNQAFSYFQFSEKNLFFSNSRLFTSRYYYVTSHYVFFNLSKVSAWLLIPYFFMVCICYIFILDNL